MLFIVFQLGNDRYALEASRVVEVLPLLRLKHLPQAPDGVAGVINYRGQPVPTLDLCAMTLGRPARERFSTRILVVNCSDDRGNGHLLGLIAEGATGLLHKDPHHFVDSGVNLAAAPYLGPILMDEATPIQLIYEHQLLSSPVREQLFAQLSNRAA